MEEYSEMIWKIWKKGKSNSDRIGKIWKKSKLNSDKIWKVWKKNKLNSEIRGFKVGRYPVLLPT
jgi:hypothetical protein